MKVNLKEMNILMNDMEVFGKKINMTCHLLSTESQTIKDVIVEAKVGVHEDTYNYLMVVYYQLEITDEIMDEKELVWKASDYILPHLSMFMQILDEQIENQKNIFCS